VTHFDLANNYGPPYGAAERNVGRILREDFRPYRDELVISSKAGWDMWPGPYGDLGSRKYLTASLDQSLQRLGLDYVDIFYHHRPDPDTPLEETMGALDAAVRAGKALYVGVSSYSPERTAAAAAAVRSGEYEETPTYRALPARTAASSAPMVSSSGVSGSGRWW
jgi:L-glyceraldehyde 3-phosphate reductase